MTDILAILKSVGALLTGDHFVFTSGKHGDMYINKDALYPHTEKVSEVGKLFAERYKDADVDTVVGPMLGGIILSQWTAHHLSQLTGRKVFGVYTEKDAGKNQIFTRGYDKYVSGKRILIVEDVANTGESAKKVVDAVKGAGGNVVSVCVMVNRDPKRVTSEFMGAPFDALGVLEAKAYAADVCPLCRNGVSINAEVGHGREFLEQQGS